MLGPPLSVWHVHPHCDPWCQASPCTAHPVSPPGLRRPHPWPGPPDLPVPSSARNPVGEAAALLPPGLPMCNANGGGRPAVSLGTCSPGSPQAQGRHFLSVYPVTPVNIREPCVQQGHPSEVVTRPSAPEIHQSQGPSQADRKQPVSWALSPWPALGCVPSI